jgi:hypothetical protein
VPIVMDMVWEGVSVEQYEEARRRVNWEGDVPAGAKLHIARFTDGGIRVTDLWESAEDFQRFVAERLMPVTTAIGITGEPQVEITPLHAVFAPDVPASDRMNLPA